MDETAFERTIRLIAEKDAAIAELVGALQTVTDHFAMVMGGPFVAGNGVIFEHGVEGIPTIARARAVLAKHNKA